VRVPSFEKSLVPSLDKSLVPSLEKSHVPRLEKTLVPRVENCESQVLGSHLPKSREFICPKS
jgi:hypothetical protein